MSAIIKPSDETYRSGIVSGDHGTTYQKNLFLILFERLTRKRREFKLAYEMMDAEKFDDIVVFLRDADNGKGEWWFFQTKHKAARSNEVKATSITYEMLFPKSKEQLKADYSLYKYLISYSIIKNRFREKKKMFIFTNRELSSESLNDRLEIVPRQEDKIMDFSGKHFGLVANDEIVTDMLVVVNQEFIALRDAILKLFQSGSVESIIYKYKTPLADVLEESNGSVRFHPNFTAESLKPEVNQLYYALEKNTDDVQSAVLILNDKNNGKKQISSIFFGNSNNKSFPMYVDEGTTREFFNDLILSVGQPDDLYPIINDDLQELMKTWLRPEFYGKLEHACLKIPFEEFEALFAKFNTNCNDKLYLKQIDGEQCFEKIKATKIFKQAEFCPFYVNRSLRLGWYDYISDDYFATKLTGRLNNQMHFILSGEPGMGKTTVMQYIAHKAQQVPNRLVYLIYLNEFQRKLQDIDNIKDLDGALLALSEVLSEAHYENIRNALAPLANEKSKRIILFFDAFDEIAGEDAEKLKNKLTSREKVLRVFDQLKKISNIQIVVDGRRHVRELLERQFNVEAITLKPFDEEDQINFLRMFWKVPKNVEPIFRENAMQLLKLFQTNNNQALIGLPLTLKMLAEVKQGDFEDVLRSTDGDENSLQNQPIEGIVDLYEKVVELNFAVKMIKLSSNNLEPKDYKAALDRFILQHQLLAVQKIVFSSWQQISKDPYFKSEYEDFLQRIQKESDKSPLVEVVDDKIQFVHLSYAEFFVAQFIYLHIEKFHPINVDDASHTWTDENPFERLDFIGVWRFFVPMIESKRNNKHIAILRQPFENHSCFQCVVINAYAKNTIKEFLKDADGNMKYGLTHEVLLEAIDEKCFEISKFLLETFDTALDVSYQRRDRKTALLFAAEHGSFEIVELLIKKRASINCIDGNGDTPLHRAAAMGHLKIVEFLLKHNANLTITNNSEYTPAHNLILSTVAEPGDYFRWVPTVINIDNLTTKLYCIKLLKLMIEKLGGVDAVYSCKQSLLHFAAEKGGLAVADFLLSHSANLNAEDIEKRTPLHLAVQHNHIYVAELLLEKSANMNAADKNGFTPFHIAASRCSVRAIQLFLNHDANINAQDVLNKQTPLHLAMQTPNIGVINLLLQNSADKNIADRNGVTPLHIAASKRHVHVVKLLLKHNANMNVKISDRQYQKDIKEAVNIFPKHSANLNVQDFCKKQTPLHVATLFQQNSVVKLLLEKSADATIADKDGLTPLHIAASKGFASIVKLFLEHNARMNVKDAIGQTEKDINLYSGHSGYVNSQDIFKKQTPLHLATLYHHIGVIKILLRQSADVNIADKDGETALHIAANKGFDNFVKLFLKNNSNNDFRDDKHALRIFHNYSANINAQDMHNQTPLHHATLNGRTRVLKLLLKKLADVNVADGKGLTPLHIAAGRGLLDVVQLFFNYNAHLNQKDTTNKQTPLHIATLNHRYAMLKLLLEKSADVNVADKYGLTPLHMAARMGFISGVKLLLEYNANLHARDAEGRTPLCLAQSGGHVEIENLLKEEMSFSNNTVKRIKLS